MILVITGDNHIRREKRDVSNVLRGDRVIKSLLDDKIDESMLKKGDADDAIAIRDFESKLASLVGRTRPDREDRLSILKRRDENAFEELLFGLYDISDSVPLDTSRLNLKTVYRSVFQTGKD